MSDFGLSRFANGPSSQQHLTPMCGTYHWMAPEVMMAPPPPAATATAPVPAVAVPVYGPPADVYSFAVICWELATQQVSIYVKLKLFLFLLPSRMNGISIPSRRLNCYPFTSPCTCSSTHSSHMHDNDNTAIFVILPTVYRSPMTVGRLHKWSCRWLIEAIAFPCHFHVRLQTLESHLHHQPKILIQPP